MDGIHYFDLDGVCAEGRFKDSHYGREGFMAVVML
jgi:hypothetical protein